ncbi:MAG: DUF3068 domain-containing protein [Catenulispora sp.]|nr:DUF3068 domain-containing protein [Catenulispora sp.]
MVYRRSAVVLGVCGLVVAVVGVVFEPVAGPMVSKLPSDTDLTVHYSGTASVIDQTAVAGGDLLGAFKTNVPVTLDRRIHVTSTSGNTSIVGDDQTLKITGMPPIPDNHVYALDRKTLEAGPAPAGKTADPASGIPIGWPVSPSAHHAYKYYDPTTQTSSDFTYTGDTEVKGRGALKFHAQTAPGPVKDKMLLATLPPTLSKSVAQTLAASPLPILPKETQALLTPDVVAALPPDIPLAYTATAIADGSADKKVGFPIEQHLQQKVIANVALPGQQPITLLPVLTTDLKLTPDSVKYLVDKADTASWQLTVVKLVVPIALVALGLLLMVLAFVKRKPKVAVATAGPAEPVTAAEPEPTPEPDAAADAETAEPEAEADADTEAETEAEADSEAEAEAEAETVPETKAEAEAEAETKAERTEEPGKTTE